MGNKGNTEAGRILMLSVTSGITFKKTLCIVFVSDSLQLLCFYMEEEACNFPANLYLGDF